MKAKSLLLLVIFTFNTLFGFGCSIFMESSAQQHSNAVHHVHNNFKAYVENSIFKATTKKDSCCKTLASTLLVQAKLLTDHSKTKLKPTALIPSFSNKCSIPGEKIISVTQRQIEQCRYILPKPDIRISIQSFQL